jgi:hypothetical protein
MNYNNYWFNQFFIDDITEEYKNEIFETLKKEDKAFKHNTLYQYCPINKISPNRHNELNHWYLNEGQNVLINLFDDLWQILYNLSEHAMPAHDARHALFKVPLSSIEFVHLEKVTDWQKVGVFGALLHDWGRWAEERVFGEPQNGMVHSRMSFVLTREFLETYPLPLEIKWHILNAVIIHTVGATEEDDMPTKLTVSADREQLWGPEFILRLFHHVPIKGHETVYSTHETTHDGILAKIKKIFEGRFPGPLHSKNEHLRVLRGVSFQFIYLLENEEFQKNAENYMDSHQSWLNLNVHELLDEIKQFKLYYQSQGVISYQQALKPKFNIDNEISISKNINQAIIKLLNSTHTAPDSLYRQKAVQRVLNTPEIYHNKLKIGLDFAQAKKIEEDKRLFESLNQTMYNMPEDKMLFHITKKLLSLIY